MRTLIATLSLMLLVAAGCGEDQPEPATTGDDAPTTSTPEETPEATEEQEPEGPGVVLTQQQAQAALLRVKDLPQGWSRSNQADDDDFEETTEPARCQQVIDALDSRLEGKAAAEAEASFDKGGPFGTILLHEVKSYDGEDLEAMAQQVADAFAECPEFTSTDKQGTRTTYQVSTIPFADLGDRTVALNIKADAQGFAVEMNLAIIVIGSNAISLFGGGLSGMDGQSLERLAQTAMQRLEQAVAAG